MIKVLTTHIGSLPFKDIDEALDFTFKFDLPVLFTLPKLNSNDLMENSIGQILTHKSVTVPYESEFFKSLNEKNIKAFKYQLTGPYTALRILDHIDPHHGHSLDYIIECLSARYQELLDRWSQYDVLIMLDEPMLASCSDDDFLKVLAFIESLDVGGKALHCCDKLDIERVNLIGQRCCIHLDLSLYSISDLKHLKVDLISGFSMVLLGDQAGLKSYLKGTLRDGAIIAPSCGLALESNTGAYELFIALEGIKAFFYENLNPIV